MTAPAIIRQEAGALPTIEEVPRPGYWHSDLSWAGHHTAVELEYD